MISDFNFAYELANDVRRHFQTSDVLQIAERSGVRIIYGKWFPVTFGELDWRSRTITINENAPIAREKIIAHELGHFFLKEYGVKNLADEESFCDDFAEQLLKADSAAEGQKLQ